MTRRKTPQEYLNQLLSKGITHRPLADYICAHTAIPHKCENGHIWNPQPKNILAGSNCPQCSRKSKMYSTKEYQAKIIDLEVLEEYKGSKVAINHRCKKGHIWKVIPNTVLNGHSCPECALYTFKDDKPALLYYILINNKYYKVGVTNRTVEERFKAEKTLIEILFVKAYPTGLEARNKEQEILNKFKDKRIKANILISGGNTELFSEDIFHGNYLQGFS